MDRRGLGPQSPTALRVLLSDTRQRGHATEEDEITPGFASVAAAVTDHTGHPVAAVAVTWATDTDPADPRAVARTAAS